MIRSVLQQCCDVFYRLLDACVIGRTTKNFKSLVLNARALRQPLDSTEICEYFSSYFPSYYNSVVSYRGISR